MALSVRSGGDLAADMLMGGLMEMHYRLMDGILDNPRRRRLNRLHQRTGISVYKLLCPGMAAMPTGAGQARAGGQPGNATAAKRADARS